MKTTFAVCGLGILAVIAISVIREIHESYAKWIALVSLVICFGIIVSSVEDAVAFMKDISVRVENKYVSVILKGLGVSVLTGVAYEICQSLGEQSIGRYIETVGKIEIIILSIPLLKELVSLILL